MLRIVTHVRLVKGSSNTRLLRFTPSTSPTVVSIGCEPGATWIVAGMDVKAMHLELFWDGKAIWVTETHQGDVSVDGEPVEHAPRRVYRGRVMFGACTLLIDTIFAAEVSPLSAAQLEALEAEKVGLDDTGLDVVYVSSDVLRAS